MSSPRVLNLTRLRDPRLEHIAKIKKVRKGRVYKGSMTKMVLKSSLRSSGQKSWVPQVVRESSSAWVTRAQNTSLDHSFQEIPNLRSIFEIPQPRTGPKSSAKNREWVRPRCISTADTTSTKEPAKVSRSGMVPAMAP